MDLYSTCDSIADDGSATVVGVHVYADEELGRSRKHCKTECSNRALKTSASQADECWCSARGFSQLGQMQAEDNIRLIQQKIKVVRKCDI